MNKMVSLILLAIFTSLLFGANAQTESDLLGVFGDKALKLQGKKLRYREVLTAPQDTAQPILVIYLHGGSGGGSDNKKQMKSPAVGKIFHRLVFIGCHGLSSAKLITGKHLCPFPQQLFVTSGLQQLP